MRVPPYSHTSHNDATLSNAPCESEKRREEGCAYLCKPAAHVVPPNAHDVAPLEGASAGAITGSIAQESAIAKAQVIYERRITYLDVERRREIGRTGCVPICVASD
jgi:hypothetical protein